MAGGKQSARQKMIGMMYLVLTALLALNVSASVLEKFLLINKSLEFTVAEKQTINAGKVESIASTVAESGNRPKDIAILNQAKEVRKRAVELVQDMEENYKQLFITSTGGIDENGTYIGLADVDKVVEHMVRNKNGEVLQAKVNDFSSYLKEVTEDSRFHDIALDAKDMSIFKDNPEQQIKDFANLHFGYNTPMVGGLASITQLQAEVLSAEGLALEDLQREVGAGDLKFDRIIAMVIPESRVVAAGATYKAEMLITAYSSGVTPTMAVNGRPVAVADGRGRVEFKAESQNFDDNGLAEKSFAAAITMRLPNGVDTTFQSTEKYFVAKPVIQIQSASVQALYLNCGNELDVQVPSLGSDYNPSFNVQGGLGLTGSEKGKVTVVPRAVKVVLGVSSGGNFIGNREFKVKRIPKPEIKVYSRGRPVDQKRGVKAPPRQLQMRAEADESFQQFLPKDARFRVSNYEIALVRGGRAVRTQRFSGPQANTANLASQARSGDTYVIDVKRIQRRNFRNEVEDFNNFGPRILNIRIN